MAVTTREDVIAIAPELSSIAADDGRWAKFIAFAELQMNAAIWGDLLPVGAAYLVAHMMTASKGQAVAGTFGPVTSQRVGDISQTFAAPSGGIIGAFSSTTYGGEYHRLVRIVGGGPR